MVQDFLDRLREFDKKRNWNGYDKEMTDQERIQYLSKILVATLGELGEFANEVKDCERDKTWKEKELKEELTDTLIFLLKMSMILKMDVKEEFYKKMAKNEERFAHFITDKKV
jgi:NTP pyrophosphatase (non-canonical NTP hydrolase)